MFHHHTALILDTFASVTHTHTQTRFYHGCDTHKFVRKTFSLHRIHCKILGKKSMPEEGMHKYCHNVDEKVW